MINGTEPQLKRPLNSDAKLKCDAWNVSVPSERTTQEAIQRLTLNTRRLTPVARLATHLMGCDHFILTLWNNPLSPVRHSSRREARAGVRSPLARYVATVPWLSQVVASPSVHTLNDRQGFGDRAR